MSTDYGFYCADCKDLCLLDNERNPKTIVHLIAHMPKLIELHSMRSEFDIEATVNYGTRIPLDWIAIHGTHKLEVVDEYGRAWPCCDKVIKDGIVNYCRRKEGHDGGCSHKGVFGLG